MSLQGLIAKCVLGGGHGGVHTQIKYALESCRSTQNTREKCCEIIKEGNRDDRQGLWRTGTYKEEGVQPFFGGPELFFF